MRVEVRNNNIDKAMRILKKKLQQEGVFNELREREFFMTKGEKVEDQELLQFVEKKRHYKKDLKILDINIVS